MERCLVAPAQTCNAGHTSVCTTQSVLDTHVPFCVGSEVNPTGRVACGSSVSLTGSTIPAIRMRILPAHTHSLTPSGSDTFHALYVLMQVLSSCRQKSCHLADSFLLICSHDKAASCVSVLDTVCTNWLHSDFKHVSSWQQVMGWYAVMQLYLSTIIGLISAHLRIHSQSNTFI